MPGNSSAECTVLLIPIFSVVIKSSSTLKSPTYVDTAVVPNHPFRNVRSHPGQMLFVSGLGRKGRVHARPIPKKGKTSNTCVAKTVYPIVTYKLMVHGT